MHVQTGPFFLLLQAVSKSKLVSSPDLIWCVYLFQYNVQENDPVDIACIPQTSPYIWRIQSNCQTGNLNDLNQISAVNAEVQMHKRVIILKCCENCNNSLFESVSLLNVILADPVASFKVSDIYLPMLDGLKVDENVK